MLTAWRELHRLRRQQAALDELPLATLTALTANLNRDSKRRPEPFTAADFAVFRERDTSDEELTPESAAVALELRAEGVKPPLLLTVWPQVIATSKAHPLSTKLMETRAYRSDDDGVWMLAPKWEGRHCRGLVMVNGRVSGPVTVRDLDKPLITHTLVIPARPVVGWVESGGLLKAAES